MAKKIIFILFLISILLISFVQAQNPKADELKKSIRNIDLIPSGDSEIIKIQNVITNCPECMGVGYLKISAIYFKNNNVLKALEYVDKINKQKLITVDNDLEDFFFLKIMQSNIYRTSGENMKALEQLEEFPEDQVTKSPYFGYFIFLLKGGIYTALQNNAESLKYFRKAYRLSKLCRKPENIKKLTVKKEIQITNSYKSTAFLAATYLEAGKLDSSKIYIKEALGDLRELDNIKNADIKYTTYLVAGSISRVEKKYKMAAANYLLSKKIVEKYWPRTDAKMSVYNYLLELYKEEKLNDSVSYYSTKILDLQSNSKEQAVNLNKSIDLNDESQTKDLKNSNRQLIYILIIIVFLCALFIYYSLVFYNKYKKRSTNIIDIPLDDPLKQALYDQAFQEVVLLGKENKPEFLTRFNALFPDFSNKLRAVNQNVQSSELRFCAYLYLNFSTKDIAEYTFTSIRTVQTKKYNLRKKLNIPTDVDIYVWFHDLLK